MTNPNDYDVNISTSNTSDISGSSSTQEVELNEQRDEQIRVLLKTIVEVAKKLKASFDLSSKTSGECSKIPEEFKGIAITDVKKSYSDKVVLPEFNIRADRLTPPVGTTKPVSIALLKKELKRINSLPEEEQQEEAILIWKTMCERELMIMENIGIVPPELCDFTEEEFQMKLSKSSIVIMDLDELRELRRYARLYGRVVSIVKEGEDC